MYFVKFDWVKRLFGVVSLWNCVLICVYDFFWLVVVVVLLIICKFLMVYFVCEVFFCICWGLLSLGFMMRGLGLNNGLFVMFCLCLFCEFWVRLLFNCCIIFFIVLIFFWNDVEWELWFLEVVDVIMVEMELWLWWWWFEEFVCFYICFLLVMLGIFVMVFGFMFWSVMWFLWMLKLSFSIVCVFFNLLLVFILGWLIV